MLGSPKIRIAHDEYLKAIYILHVLPINKIMRTAAAAIKPKPTPSDALLYEIGATTLASIYARWVEYYVVDGDVCCSAGRRREHTSRLICRVGGGFGGSVDFHVDFVVVVFAVVCDGCCFILGAKSHMTALSI